MKKLFVALRVLKLRGGSVATINLGVFTDKADAIKAADEGPKAIAGAHPSVKAAIGFLGVEEVHGAWMELPYVAGSGIEIPDSKLILPGH